MPSLTRRQSSSQSASSRDPRSRGSKDSYDSQSTTPTSTYTSSRPSESKSSRSSGGTSGSGSYTYSSKPHRYQQAQSQGYGGGEDISPGASLFPRSSVDTYASTTTSEEGLDAMELDAAGGPMDYEHNSIPPLPEYRREVVEPNVRPSSPQDFAKLFPSLNRFSIRHDEYTSDGNMNLRIDTVVTGRRRTAIQLFHLRMYDLAKREFSLRRYCRDSGREVCNSKRKYIEPSAPKLQKKSESDRPTLQRSMSSAFKTLGGGGSGGKPSIRRTNSGGSFFSSKSSSSKSSSSKSSSSKRPSTSNSNSSCDGDDESFVDGNSRVSLADSPSNSDSKSKGKQQKPEATKTIKLEFSNYARVDVHRRGKSKNKRYEFDWWGHRYLWKRSVDKQLGLVSFHLVRDGNANRPVAHIVPETRSPSQVLADESAGGWVPPCFMWIADETILDAMTDVADVIMATGLMALVDDCIKERWQTKKVHRIPVPLTTKTVDVAPKAFIQHVFGRRDSKDNHHPHHHPHHHHHHFSPPSPLRYANPISAY